MKQELTVQTQPSLQPPLSSSWKKTEDRNNAFIIPSEKTHTLCLDNEGMWAQYSWVYILIQTARFLCFQKHFNYLLWCDTGDSSLQSKDKPAITPNPPSHKHPLHLKSKPHKWLDEIRATRLAVKLNRICACWFEDLHTILSTQRGESGQKSNI